MISEGPGEALDDVLDRLTAVEAENRNLTGEVERLTRGRSSRVSYRLSRARQAGQAEIGPVDGETVRSRRWFFRRAGGVATAGLGIAAAGSVLGAHRAEATHLPGFGHSNSVAQATSTSGRLAYPDSVFSSQNVGTGGAIRGTAAHDHAIYGWTNATRANGGAGVFGYNNNDGDGVSGRGGANGVFGLSYNPEASGVYGENQRGGYGVAGRVTGATTTGGVGILGDHEGAGDGVYGKSGAAAHSGVIGENLGTGVGVAGSSASGTGMQASSTKGIALKAVGKVTFSRSGVVVVAQGATSVTKGLVPVDSTTSILAVVQQNVADVWVRAVAPSASTDKFTVYLNKAAPVAVRVAWFALN